MSNRIQPTHFIKVWGTGWNTYTHSSPLRIGYLFSSIIHGATPIALFLIRPKTPQEQANSIYYPLNEQK